MGCGVPVRHTVMSTGSLAVAMRTRVGCGVAMIVPSPTNCDQYPEFPSIGRTRPLTLIFPYVQAISASLPEALRAAGLCRAINSSMRGTSSSSSSRPSRRHCRYPPATDGADTCEVTFVDHASMGKASLVHRRVPPSALRKHGRCDTGGHFRYVDLGSMSSRRGRRRLAHRVDHFRCRARWIPRRVPPGGPIEKGCMLLMWVPRCGSNCLAPGAEDTGFVRGSLRPDGHNGRALGAERVIVEHRRGQQLGGRAVGGVMPALVGPASRQHPRRRRRSAAGRSGTGAGSGIPRHRPLGCGLRSTKEGRHRRSASPVTGRAAHSPTIQLRFVVELLAVVETTFSDDRVRRTTCLDLVVFPRTIRSSSA